MVVEEKRPYNQAKAKLNSGASGNFLSDSSQLNMDITNQLQVYVARPGQVTGTAWNL